MDLKYIYGPIPSRRLGYSLGVAPIFKKTCNYSCIYCQLGRTKPLTNKREVFIDLNEIISELTEVINQGTYFDVVSIVGEGEPTLYKDLKNLIKSIKKLTIKPVCVITNGALLTDIEVFDALMEADIVLPSLNAFDEVTFKKINRPYPNINFKDTYQALIDFSHKYQGEIWLEIMLLKGINDDDKSLENFKQILQPIRYSRLYLNTPVRPPAENYVEVLDSDRMQKAVEVLKGISIELLSNETYVSSIQDDYEAILSIISRHPMNQFEISGFLEKRNVSDKENIFIKLNSDVNIEIIAYKGYKIYRIKV